MDFRIELWLKGYMFCSEPLEIPEHDDRMVFQEQLEYRESLVQSAVVKMKALYHGQIDKCHGIYQLYIIAPSKIELQIHDYETDNGEDERQIENSAYADDRNSQ